MIDKAVTVLFVLACVFIVGVVFVKIFGFFQEWP